MIEDQGFTKDGLPLIRRTYYSVMDFCADAKRGFPAYKKIHEYQYGLSFFDSSLSDDMVFSSSFAGLHSWKEVEALCRDGWTKNLPEVFNIVDVAVRYIEGEIEQFEPQFSLTGGDVDIASAVAGLPQDMVDYPLTMVSNVGSVVTVVCDVQCHAGVSAKSVEKRGMVLVALALSLECAGHQTELWLSDEYSAGKNRVILRTRVKGSNDFIDPAKIMYAYAHPSVQRALGFCVVAGLPRPWSAIASEGYGRVCGVTKDFPDGTLYVEPTYRYTDSPNLDTELRMYLLQLGIINEEGL